MIKLAIFDLDGTLVDSMKYWSMAPYEYVRIKGLKAEEKLSDKFLSMSLRESAEYFKKKYSLEDSIEKMMQDIDDIMDNFYMNYVEIKPGIRDLLEALYTRNVKMCIASATDKYLIEKVIKKLNIDKYFSYITTSSIVGSSKSKPDIYMSCSDYFNIDYKDTIIFEDLPYGIISSKPKGFYTVGLYDEPSKHLECVIKNNAHYFIKELNDIEINNIINIISK